MAQVSAIARAPRSIRPKPLLVAQIKGSPRSPPHAGESGLATFKSVSEVVSFLEVFVDHVQNSVVDKEIKSAVLTLCSNLKAYGPQLETLYKDQLDHAFIHLRNASQDDKLDELCRLHLLEVVELRASRWLSRDPKDNSYYQQKLLEVEESYEYSEMGQNNVTPSSSSTSLAVTGFEASSPPPLLLPGEVVKSSGRYTVGQGLGPTKISGKNCFKEEVVIRNADSGKVMGIKGRRVHLIEEISDTIISFQRVNPGAKERLVQITGAGGDNIERARQLMEETIVRNASPMRVLEPSLSEDCHAQLDAEAETPIEENKRRESAVEAALNEFRYSVCVGDQTVHITGHNLDLVRVSKLVLDEYFSALAASDHSRNAGPNKNSPEVSLNDTIPVPSHESARRTYPRDFLILWSNSPLCKQPPPCYEHLVQLAPEIVRKVADLQKESQNEE